jgi:hypothetical protein
MDFFSAKSITVFCFLLMASFLDRSGGCMPSDVNRYIELASDTYVCLTIAPIAWTWGTAADGNSTGAFIRMPSVVKADTMGTLNIRQGNFLPSDAENEYPVPK